VVCRALAGGGHGARVRGVRQPLGVAVGHDRQRLGQGLDGCAGWIAMAAVCASFVRRAGRHYRLGRDALPRGLILRDCGRRLEAVGRPQLNSRFSGCVRWVVQLGDERSCRHPIPSLAHSRGLAALRKRFDPSVCSVLMHACSAAMTGLDAGARDRPARTRHPLTKSSVMSCVWRRLEAALSRALSLHPIGQNTRLLRRTSRASDLRLLPPITRKSPSPCERLPAALRGSSDHLVACGIDDGEYW